MKYIATLAGTPTVIDVTGGTDGRYRLTIGDEVWEVDARLTAQGFASLLVGGVSYVADVVDRDGTCVVDVGGESYEILVEEQTRWIIRTPGWRRRRRRPGPDPHGARFRVRSLTLPSGRATRSRPATPWW